MYKFNSWMYIVYHIHTYIHTKRVDNSDTHTSSASSPATGHEVIVSSSCLTGGVAVPLSWLTWAAWAEADAWAILSKYALWAVRRRRKRVNLQFKSNRKIYLQFKSNRKIYLQFFKFTRKINLQFQQKN